MGFLYFSPTNLEVDPQPIFTQSGLIDVDSSNQKSELFQTPDPQTPKTWQ